MDTLLQDLRYAFRGLLRSPVFTCIAVLSLGLGIGANTAIFSLIDALLFRPLPVPEPERLVRVAARQFPYTRYEQFRDRNEVFADVAAVAAVDQVPLLGESGGEALRLSGRIVSGSYFRMMGARALIGRVLTPEDDRVPGGSAVAVVSYAFWKQRLGGDSSVVGKTLHLGPGRLVWGAAMSVEEGPEGRRLGPAGSAFEVVGVILPSFTGETVGDAPDFYVPMMMQASLMPGREWLGRRNVGWVRVLGRLKPDVSYTRAQAGMEVLLHQLIADELGSRITDEHRKAIGQLRVEILPAGTGLPREEYGKNSVSSLREFSEPLFILMGVVAAVLLIACANVASLQLARATARGREMALRVALGARRSRLVRQLLTESLLISVLGAGVGLLFAAWGSATLVALVGAFTTHPIAIRFRPDLRVLAFTGVVTVLTGMLFGLAPALQSARVDVIASLKDTVRGAGGSPGRLRLRKALVVAQVALSLMLLVGAALFVRSLQKLRGVDLGYVRENLLIVRVDPVTGGYRGAEISRLVDQLQQRFAALPGVRAVTFSENGLFSGPESAGPIIVEGYGAAGKPEVARFDQVGPGYFSTVGIPILLGRDFTAQDAAGAPRTVIVNEAFARFYFQGTNPVGRQIFWLPGQRTGLEIVGVAANVKDHSLRWGAIRRFYVPMHQPIEAVTTVNFEVRTTGDPQQAAGAIRRELGAVDPTLPLVRLDTLEGLIDRSLIEERLIASLSGFFGVLALVLACTGLYGVMSYSVARRTSELGLRMALGAGSGDVLRLILRESVVLVGLGIALGVPAALAAARLISSRLFGLGAADPRAVATATLLLLLVALLAGYVPARRAGRIDPMVALRTE